MAYVIMAHVVMAYIGYGPVASEAATPTREMLYRPAISMRCPPISRNSGAASVSIGISGAASVSIGISGAASLLIGTALLPAY